MRQQLTDLREWIRKSGLDPNKALDELQKWDRKYYSYTIGTSRHIQPGDGMYVKLTGGGRTVSVGEEEFEDLEDTGEGYGPTMGEVILAALREWHADRTPKNFRANGHWTPGKHTPEPSNPHGEEIKGWAWTYKNEWSGAVEIRLTAPTEHEALQILRRDCPNYEGRFSIWEVSDRWYH